MGWKPKTGHPYWMINSRFEVKQAFNNGGRKSNERIRAGNCFMKREQATIALNALREHTGLTRWQHLRKALFR